MREACDEAAADRIGYDREHDRNCSRLAGKGASDGSAPTEERVGPQIDQPFCKRPEHIRITIAPAKFDPEIAAFSPPQLRESTPQRRNRRLPSRIALNKAHEHADQPHPVRLLLPARHDRQRCSAANERDELAPPHSITSSARASSEGGTVRPRAFAVLRLITNSIFV